MMNITWKYNGNKYKVGESVDVYPWKNNNIFPIVFYKGRLYTAYIKPSNKVDRICLTNIYYPDNKPYWTTVDKVFNIIKL